MRKREGLFPCGGRFLFALARAGTHHAGCRAFCGMFVASGVWRVCGLLVCTLRYSFRQPPISLLTFLSLSSVRAHRTTPIRPLQPALPHQAVKDGEGGSKSNTTSPPPPLRGSRVHH